MANLMTHAAAAPHDAGPKVLITSGTGSSANKFAAKKDTNTNHANSVTVVLKSGCIHTFIMLESSAWFVITGLSLCRTCVLNTLPIFSDLMADFLVGFMKLSSAAENPAVATALTAALSWWIFGAFVRILGIWTPKR